MTKPINPNITIPANFAQNGQKTDFAEEKILSGFNPLEPDILSGDNLNKFIDDTYKGLNYSMDGVSDLYKGAVLYNSDEEYSRNSIVFHVDTNSKTHLFRSVTNNNLGNSLSNTTYWEEIIIDTSSFLSKSGDTMTGKLTITSGGLEVTSGDFIFPSTNRIDGQWIYSYQLLSQAVNIGIYEIDLTTFLPNDNYNYEVLFVFEGFRSGGTTNSLVSLCPTNDVVTTSTDIATKPCYGVADFDGDHAEAGCFSCLIPITTTRKIYYGIQRFKLGSGYLIMMGYRRIGTNS